MSKVFLLRRHVLCPVILHHYAQYQSAQPQCQGQAHCWEIHLYEPWHQWRWWPARGAAQGEPHRVTTIRNKKKERGLNPHVCSWSSLCLIFMQNLYESIKNEPFKIPEDDGNDLTHTFFNPDREGWLLKLGKSASGVQILKCASPPPLKSNLIQAVLLFQFRTTFFFFVLFFRVTEI